MALFLGAKGMNCATRYSGDGKVECSVSYDKPQKGNPILELTSRKKDGAYPRSATRAFCEICFFLFRYWLASTSANVTHPYKKRTHASDVDENKLVRYLIFGNGDPVTVWARNSRFSLFTLFTCAGVKTPSERGEERKPNTNARHTSGVVALFGRRAALSITGRFLKVNQSTRFAIKII